MPKTPKPRFVMIGKGKYVHVVHTELFDRKNSKCQTVRKATVAGKVPGGSLSPEAALALDGCDNCGTHEVAKAALPAESKRQAAADKRDDVLKRAKGETLSEKRRKAVKTEKPKAEPKAKAEKPAKAPAMTKAGPRSVASSKDGDPAKAKAEQLILFGKEHGWDSTLTKDEETGHWVVTAERGNETITAWYIDGKYDVGRHAEITVGSWTGKLRGAHACRRQMAAEGRDRPHPEPGKGRTGPKRKETEEEIAENESPEDAAKRVPFSSDDDDIVIIDMLKGKTIRWRNSISGKVEEAMVPSNSKRTIITTHPKTGRRILDFLEVVESEGGHEVVGPERNVALDKIVRVL